MVEVPIPKEKWTGKIGTVTLGVGAKAKVCGGEGGMPFLSYEAVQPRPLIAGEVSDVCDDVHASVRACFTSVLDPAQYAREWVEVHGADLICLRLVSTNPEELNATAEQAAITVMKVLAAVDVPLIIYGCGTEEKDARTMGELSAQAKGQRLLLGQAEEGVYKSLSAAAMGGDHCVIGFSNLDINLAKQIAILLTDFGVKKESIVVDPLMAALGMGLEYSYSVNERIRLAGLMGDAMLQVPMLCDCTSAWKCREATDDLPNAGDSMARGVWWEATTAMAALLSGADILVIRHPQAAEIAREAIKGLRGE
jgi:CO dehydrogenase/acetyl-CoA synthase delta subunit